MTAFGLGRYSGNERPLKARQIIVWNHFAQLTAHEIKFCFMFVYNRYYRLNLRGVKNTLCNSFYYQIFNTMIKKTGILLVALTISYALFSSAFAQSAACEFANSDTTTVPASSLLGSVNNAGLAVDGDVATASNLIANVTLLGSGSVSQTLIFPTVSTLNDSVTILLGYGGSALQTLAQVSQSVTFETFNGATSNGDAAPLNMGLIKVGNGGNTFTYGIRPAAQFDRVKFTLTPGPLTVIGASCQLDIYYACKGPYPVSSSGAGLCTNAGSAAGSTSASCVGCAVANPDRAVDTDVNSFAAITVPVSLLGGSAMLDVSDFPTAGKVGDTVQVIVGVNAALLNAGTSGVIIETLNAGVSNGDSVTLDNNTATVVDSTKRVYMFQPAYVYDAVRVTVKAQVASVGGSMLSEVRVYGVCKRDFVASPFVTGDVCIGGDSTATTATGNPPAPLPRANYVESPANAIDNNSSNYSTINVALGVVGSGSAAQYIHFQNQGCTGDTIKAIIQDNNGNPASVSALGQITVQLFNGSTPVGTPTTASSSTVTGLQTAGKTELLFASSDQYDGFQITLNSANTVGALNSLRFYGVCAQPKTPPQLDTTNSTLNICYNSKATLKTTVPTGATVEWFLSPTASPSSLVFTGPTFVTPNLTNTTTFYARTTLNAGGCTSNILIPYTVVVNRQLPAPVLLTTPSLEVCLNGDTLLAVSLPTLTPPLTNGLVKWYDAPTGGNLVFIGTSFRTPAVRVPSVVYYLETDSVGCTSLARTSLTVTTRDKVFGPVVTCGSQVVFSGATQFQWTPVPNATKYYVKQCSSCIPIELDSLRYHYGGQTPGSFSTITVYAGGFNPVDICAVSKESQAVTCRYNGCDPYTVSFTAVNPIQCLPASVDFIDNTPGTVKWSWKFGDGDSSNVQNPTHIYTVPGYYDIRLDVEKSDNCKGSQISTNFVQICATPNVFFPSAFTPNGDNLNDTYTAVGGGVETFEMEIYNQWGEKVFATQAFFDAWNGKKNNTGDDLPEGVYAYRAKVKLVESPELVDYKGNITLIR